MNVQDNTECRGGMSHVIDARGLACPQPVVKVKQAFDAGRDDFEILVDDEAARENILKFVEHAGAVVESIVTENGVHRMRIRRGGDAESAAPASKDHAAAGGRTLLITTNAVGSGNEELGRKLMQVFLETLNALETKPSTIILMNNGVRLAVEETATVESLNRLTAAGVELLVCGTCLDYFGLKESLRAGCISNMLSIAEKLLAGPPVISF